MSVNELVGWMCVNTKVNTHSNTIEQHQRICFEMSQKRDVNVNSSDGSNIAVFFHFPLCVTPYNLGVKGRKLSSENSRYKRPNNTPHIAIKS